MKQGSAFGLHDQRREISAVSKHAPLVKVALVEEIPEGTVKHVIVHDKPIALCRVQGSFYAINAVCPHMGAGHWAAAAWRAM